MFLLLLLVLIFVGWGIVEYQLHLRNLRTIPIRVQVNGTRGKSSVTRLIAAGLRAGGYRVVAKVTGTKPRFIIGDDEEYPVRRLGKANIIEELRIVRLARHYQAQVLVIECMALVPEYQRVENRMLIRPTHGVITNVRADHLDVMGPTVLDVARALSNTIPLKGRFFTAERGTPLKILKQHLRPGVEMTVTDPRTVSDEEIAGFSYVEHKENVALALAVCASLGVERKTALAGMQRSLPDSGVMRIYRITDRGKILELVNTLAANDPDSIGMLWQMVRNRNNHRIVLVNCRRDRADRSRQLAELVKDWEYDYLVVTGGLTGVFVHRAIQVGVTREKIIDLGGEIDPAVVYDRVWSLVEQAALIFATGNTVGYGEKLINCFVSKSEER
ncbi:MAG: poly-gamma-glutamate synthase PgsB [candidate division WOR-3 bacterium]|uniref:Poly-gamma-glutamate synthase PgsB n=2 Tax=candidate division WOR-3 bacterium TaxID=2052148 RepID=A0A7C1NDH5_UNCW3|nr:poly-gamma-glutamate synthase PgsB [candidate division WOR-3 bacterium]